MADTETSTTTTAPKISFADKGRARMKTIDLDWPVVVDGVTIEAVTLRRLTGGEVAELQEGIERDGNDDNAMIAQFADQPVQVINALDQDDCEKLKEATFDFLPQSIRAGIEAAAASSPTGDPSSPKSPTPSSGAKATS